MRPNIFIRRILLAGAPGGSQVCSISPFKPIVTNLPTWLRLGVFVVACGLLESCWSSGGTDVQPIFGTGL